MRRIGRIGEQIKRLFLWLEFVQRHGHNLVALIGHDDARSASAWTCSTSRGRLRLPSFNVMGLHGSK
jgi:hypothetical protein